MSVVIRPLSTPAELRAFVELEQRVWPGVPSMRDDVLLVAQRNGGLVLGAFDVVAGRPDNLVGLLYGYVGRTSDGRYRHWSHMVGIDPAYRDQRVGYRLKLAQREHVVAQGLDMIAWSYDPLLSRNAYFNIHKLGAVCGTYTRDFYGEMADGLNAGLPSDRFEVEWHIASRHVAGRLHETDRVLTLTDLLASGARVVNPGTDDEIGLHIDEPGSRNAGSLCIRIPSDFHALKSRDMGLARRWREYARNLFECAFADGYLVVDVARDATGSYYWLTRDWQLS